MVGQGKFYGYENIILVRAGDDLRIQSKGDARAANLFKKGLI